MLVAEGLARVIRCSTLKKYPDDSRQITRGFNYEEEFIRQVTGGLVDVDPQSHKIQLMHQTIKEFVEAHQFRNIVLGHDRVQITGENGHSF